MHAAKLVSSSSITLLRYAVVGCTCTITITKAKSKAKSKARAEWVHSGVSVD